MGGRAYLSSSVGDLGPATVVTFDADEMLILLNADLGVVGGSIVIESLVLA